MLLAVSVSVWVLFHVTAWLTLTLPAVPLLPSLLLSETLPLARLLSSVAAVMSPPLAAMVKSVGSTSHVPLLPPAALVVIAVPSATCTCAPEVSMKPPLPPAGALASSVPPAFTVPASMPPSRVMTPSCSATVRACTVPALLTTLSISEARAPAVISTLPPSATISWRFSTRLRMVFASTTRCIRWLSAKVSVIAVPPPSATVPSCARIVPWLETVLPSSAT